MAHSLWAESVVGKQNGVNYVDYPVGSMEIRSCDGGRTAFFIGENDFSVLQSCSQRVAGYSLQLGLAAVLLDEFDQIVGVHIAGHHMVGDDLSQLILVFRLQQRIYGA